MSETTAVVVVLLGAFALLGGVVFLLQRADAMKLKISEDEQQPDPEEPPQHEERDYILNFTLHTKGRCRWKAASAQQASDKFNKAIRKTFSGAEIDLHVWTEEKE